jgi:hypothetical protein
MRKATRTNYDPTNAQKDRTTNDSHEKRMTQQIIPARMNDPHEKTYEECSQEVRR